MRLHSGLFVFVFLVSGLVTKITVADENTQVSSVIKAEVPKSNVGGDLDREVSDPKLRTMSGAKSVWSSSFLIDYAGGSLRKPIDASRPNPSGDRVAEPVYLSGNFGLRYRSDIYSSFYFATGFFQQKPFHRSDDSGDGGEPTNLELSTPQVSYNRTFAFGDIQFSNSVNLFITTQKYLRAIGNRGSLGYSLSALGDLGTSKFHGGVSLLARVTAFDKNDQDLRSMQSDYGITLTPSLQYDLSDRANVYTSVSLINFAHYRSDEGTSFIENHLTETLGLGLSVLRDFYVAPYFTFDPARFSWRTSSVNLSVNVNL